MEDGSDCTTIVYQEPTPMWYHSYGLDTEGNLRRSSQLATRREVLLRKFVPEAEQLWEVQEKAQKVMSPITIGRCVMDVTDHKHHSWAYQTVTSGQDIGWFADSKRLPKCRLREWPKHYSLV
ncbi:hypothetical protein BsWGS_26947 [Bradybaena similaris]